MKWVWYLVGVVKFWVWFVVVPKIGFEKLATMTTCSMAGTRGGTTCVTKC